ncbi:MAG: aminodeoxychorismate/anthranilate synthase component II [Alphaproteobacteria bacterium]|nr:aminodeoxychorismate/anthranilate synthase component II [Alphaproteobacteria bacterium]
MIVLIDNYDSFTYNLVQYLGGLKAQIAVHRNDKITVEEVLALKPAGIVISPGPGNPDESGICLELIQHCINQKIPLLGVCLGHQCIGQVTGGRVVRAAPMHGKISDVTHTGQGVFKGLPSPFQAARYHSLIVEKETLSPDLEITAETSEGLIMGVHHRHAPVQGVQFHPESIATQHGHAMLSNFIESLCPNAMK